MRKIILPFFILIVISLSYSCKQSSKSQDNATEFDTLISSYTSMFGSKSSLQTIAEVLIKSGIEYNPDITIDTLIQPEYTQSVEAAGLYCGMFSADALYHSAFLNSDAAFESYTSAQVLANFLGIGPFYVENLLKRNKEDLTEADSILYNFDKVLAEFDTAYSQEERFRIITSYLIGNLIEKLYLLNEGVKSLEGMPVTEITQQARFIFKSLELSSTSVDMFVAILDKYSQNKGNPLHVEFITLQSLYQELEQKGVPNYKPGDTYEPTEEMKNISLQVEKIRNQIIAI